MYWLLTLSIEKDRAVLYRDFVTILCGASLEYITKLETPHSQKCLKLDHFATLYHLNRFAQPGIHLPSTARQMLTDSLRFW
jgi:hypothetical protein